MYWLTVAGEEGDAECGGTGGDEAEEDAAVSLERLDGFCQE